MGRDEQPLRIVIAEDWALLREGLASLIADSGGLVVAKVADGPSFVAAVVDHRPDVSVVDVRMPPSQRDEGLRAAIEARRRVPGSPVLVLSQASMPFGSGSGQEIVAAPGSSYRDRGPGNGARPAWRPVFREWG